MRVLLMLFMAVPSFSWATRSSPPLPTTPNIQRQEAVNDYYLDEIRHKASDSTRLERTRDHYKDNPRNLSFAASFGSLYSKTPVMIK